MKKHVKRNVLLAIAVVVGALLAAQTARVETQVTTERSAIMVTPNAVLIGGEAGGTTKIATVVVTNVSKLPVHGNVLWNADWFQVSPSSVDLDPGKSTSLTITGNVGALRQILSLPTREDQIVDRSQRPIIGTAPVTISTGRSGTVFVVFGVRFGAN